MLHFVRCFLTLGCAVASDMVLPLDLLAVPGVIQDAMSDATS